MYNKLLLPLILTLLVVIFHIITIDISSVLAVGKYYSEQIDYEEISVPMTSHRWNQENIESCIYKEDAVDNAYYVWTKISIQEWRQALREYTGNQEGWNITAHYVKSEPELESCDLKVYIYNSYQDFPQYPDQTGAYTSFIFNEGEVNDPDVRVYLSPVVLHGDGATEIELPPYAFRNSAVHEVGHVLGLGHMQSEKGYLMSPQFDFWETNEQLPITKLELDALIQAYGTEGFD